MLTKLSKTIEDKKKNYAKSTASALLKNGTLIEMLYQPDNHKTMYCVARDGKWHYADFYKSDTLNIAPYKPENNLIQNKIVLLPSDVEEYSSETELIADIQSYIHKYMDIPELFEKVSSYYILLSWVYDRFSELPYLRVQGDYGTGKTRFLLTIGSLCYKPIFANGASTISPLFRLLNDFRGTLIIDESDFRFSDEKTEFVKILNNGNARGFPVLRSETNYTREFNPRAFVVFGPKLVATCGPFQDPALESRFLTHNTGQNKLRRDIPINLSKEHQEEAQRLRNKLLLFRIRNFHKVYIHTDMIDWEIEPRLNQIFIPLLSVIQDETMRDEIRLLARQFNKELVMNRGTAVEGQVLDIIKDILQNPNTKLTVKDITDWFTDRYGDEYQRKITTKWIGFVIRSKLNLKTAKSNGNYIIPPSEEPKLRILLEKYGLDTQSENKQSSS
ncbi:MAG: hypothetical protein COV57_03425 [Candidatus Liptonbacteria bacterium CG11_big_fil_rev_8_21_14_0_20_35_14]|uniref:DUF3631 domain-containing protein n=1 Tax=Candidatus Liptonbacteria bacterium CG11_big_fil_rev_8_21_14_0_20_35_14 TaxID=1974634 RepID=A0A2H0N6S7_9BACT|nr:MAG: hypothetical protein COV57_03425 [Candidatus Liptonbacteria bacterium CG11_big_fil_rev_8_21_14_0_20_35_14]